MRLADLILSKGVHHPSDPVGRSLADPYIREGVERAVVVDATNVLNYIVDLPEPPNLYDLACAAPPHDSVFVEYRRRDGEMSGMLGCADEGPFSIRGLKPTGSVGDNGSQHLDMRGLDQVPLWISNTLPDQDAWDRVRWVWHTYLYEQVGGRVIGPLTRQLAALDQWGGLIDAMYSASAPEVRDGINQVPFLVFMSTMNFMQCANIRTQYVEPPAAVSRKHRRKGHINRDLVRYVVLQIKPTGPATRTRGQSSGEGGFTAFHPVRGEFHHYGDCCPGRHAPKGLLFGKLEGRFWVPAHSRGNPEQGQVVHDFKVGPVED